MDRSIIHIDMNSAFAAIECFHRPEIRTYPVVVAGRPELRKGIVLARNFIAKKYDIKTAETLNDARAKCPELVVVPPNYPLYKRYCDRAYEGDETRHHANGLGYTVVVPPKSNRLDPWEYNRELYKQRNEIERLFRRLKSFRRVFTRYEKLDVLSIGFALLALIVETLRCVNTP